MKKDNQAVENDFIVKKNEPQNKDIKKDKKKDKKPNIFKRMGSKIKDIFSELKKVSWPALPKVVKQTGIVIVVVLVFLVVITAFDFGLLQLLRLVTNVGA